MGMTPTDLRILRARYKWTQEDLAKELDVSTQTIRNYEGGRTPIPKVVGMAAELIERHNTELTPNGR